MDRVIVIAGSREARILSDALGDQAVLVDVPDALPPGEIRAVIDASHPCERETHARASRFCADAGLPLLRFRRPGWIAASSDRWHRVASAAQARDALDPSWERVFLCLSAQDRIAFSGDAHRHYLVRSRRNDPAGERLDHFDLVSKDGPYQADGEAALMRHHGIDVLVTRDAGGRGAYPKIEAARAIGLPVILLDRPTVTCAEAGTVPEALDWVSAL